MKQISVIGLDLAKHVFQVHGVDEVGGVTLIRQITRWRAWPGSCWCETKPIGSMHDRH
jgi:hypothetical protein